MKKNQKYFNLCIALLLFFTFSMLFIGCWEDGESKFQTEKVEGKQLMEKNSLNANEADVIIVDTSDAQASQVFPVDDEIHLDEWIQLVKDIKSTLGEVEEVSNQVLEMSESR